ncbi:UNVERIFIED_CONTAM: hypothetical protein GTU68_027766 [Idotea baltica]|nr:hypothetical protein [Idotea baltica]
MTGASGSAYAVRLAQVLLQAEYTVHLVASDAARQVSVRELGVTMPADSASSDEWISFLATSLHSESKHDYSAGIASGSFLTAGMVVCPCSMGTLSSIANGASTNLVQRAADVHLKERRPLVLVPRETPLGMIALQNMTTLTQAGATIMPSMPGFYQYPTCIADLIDFVVARACDHLKVEHSLIERWGEGSQ